jgi:5,5'-dehydrodivanillate O-demethylase
VLSQEKNERLTRVGRGTPMGELLRRYWHPVAPVLEIRDRRVMPVRLLGQDLVLFAAQDGRFGLIARQCPHRGADLSYGWVDGSLLRCPYHGWAFDVRGRCGGQPFEEVAGHAGFRDRATVDGYPTASLGGLVWVYLGPEPAPLLPDFEPFSWTQGFVEISITELPCNWFQCHENGVDPVHFEWLHGNWTAVQQDPQTIRRAAEHISVEFDEFEFGFVCGRQIGPGGAGVRPLNASNTVAEGGMLCMWPYTLMTGATVEWRVPIDDCSTLNITRQYSTLPDDIRGPVQDLEAVPYWHGPLTDPSTGRILTGNTLNQDFAAWVGQGVVADRTREHLGRTDSGLTRLRHRFLQEMGRVADGADPAGTVRDQARNQRIALPIYRKSRYTGGITREAYEGLLAWHRSSPFAVDGYPAIQAGRPAHVIGQYEMATRG